MSYDDAIDDELATAAEPEPAALSVRSTEQIDPVPDEPTSEHPGQEPHKGTPVRSRPDLVPVTPDPDLEAIRARTRSLYRQHTATVHGAHWGTITAEPAMLDVPASRYIVIRNLGPDPLYLSNIEGAPAFATVAPPELTVTSYHSDVSDGGTGMVHVHERRSEAKAAGGEFTVEGRVFLRSAGDSSVHVAEYHNHQEAAA